MKELAKLRKWQSGSKASSMRGFAIVTMILLMVMVVMVVTIYSTWVQTLVTLSMSYGDENLARFAASSGISQAMAYLVDDRPQGSPTADTRVVITEVLLRRAMQEKIKISGFYENGSADEVLLFNAGAEAVDLEGWAIDDDAAPDYEELIVLGGLRPLDPGKGIWVSSGSNGRGTGNFIPASSATLKSFVLYKPDGVGDSSPVDSVVFSANGSTKWICVPSGGNSGAYVRPDTPVNSGFLFSNADKKTGISDDINIETYAWVAGGFQTIPAGAPAWNDTVADSGIWIGGWADRNQTNIGYTLSKKDGATVLGQYTFDTAYLGYGNSLVIRNNLTGWSYGIGGDFHVVAGSKPSSALIYDTFPYLDSRSDNNISFELLNPMSAVVSLTGTLDFTSSDHYTRTSLTDPEANMSSTVTAPSPGTPDLAYQITNVPFISEVDDADDPGGAVEKLADPGFEAWTGIDNGSPQWTDVGTGSSIGKSTAIFRNGGGSLWLNNPTTAYSGRGSMSDSPAVIAGTTVDYGCWGYLDPVGGGAIDESLSVTVEFLDSAKNPLSSDVSTSNFAAASTWELTSASAVNVPVSTEYARILVQGKEVGSGDNYDIYVDDCYLTGNSPASFYGPDEFIEISLGAKLASIRDVEYIEIFNTDSKVIDLVANDYWISVGSSTAANKRYIVPFEGTSETVTIDTYGMTYKGVAVIVSIDADTPVIASMSGLKTSDISWFGLAATAGATYATDNFIGANGAVGLNDAGDIIILGRDGASPAGQLSVGGTFPDMKVEAETVSWQKSNESLGDDATTPYDDELYLPTDHPSYKYSNWDTVIPTSVNGPGRFRPATGGRIGVDAAYQPWISDTWFRYMGETYAFTAIPSSTGETMAYFRIRIFDEGAKFNINALSNATWESEVIEILLEGGNDDFGDRGASGGVFVGGVQTFTPSPPFATTFDKKNVANDPPFSSDITIEEARRYVKNLAGDTWQPANGEARIFSPQGAGAVGLTTSSPPNPSQRLRWRLPYLTPYGYEDPDANQVNVNLAETPVLTAAFWVALKDYPVAGGQFSLREAYVLADSVYQYLTNGDTNSNNHRFYSSLAEIRTTTPNLNDTHTNALIWAEGNGNLSRQFALASSNYFTIFAEGFVFPVKNTVATMNVSPSASPSDTPVARSRIVAVVKRSTIADQGEIVFWREVMADDKTKYPTGTLRYPAYIWDPIWKD